MRISHPPPLLAVILSVIQFGRKRIKFQIAQKFAMILSNINAISFQRPSNNNTNTHEI